jgi:hypothetical protein
MQPAKQSKYLRFKLISFWALVLSLPLCLLFKPKKHLALRVTSQNNLLALLLTQAFNPLSTKKLATVVPPYLLKLARAKQQTLQSNLLALLL